MLDWSKRDEHIPLLENRLTQHFNDGRRRIDAILVYKPERESEERDIFLRNLRELNIELEYESSAFKSTTAYIKVHAPKSVLYRNAEKYNIPVKFQQLTTLPEPKVRFAFMMTILTNPDPPESDPVYQRARDSIAKKQPRDFTLCERSSIVFTILQYTKFGDSPFDVGLPQLLHRRAFIDAYPLHDGPWQWSESDEPLCDRQLLARYWASFKMWNKQQPLNNIEKYFGCEIAMYFGWLGFYNKMLIFASILGVLCSIYGLFSVNTTNKVIIEEACSSDLLLCPNCRLCGVRKLKDYCDSFRIAYINDNAGSVFFAFFMSFWATLFMELWKREQATLSVRWNLDTNTLEENLRPEFQARAKNYRKHKYTGEIEQYIDKKITCFFLFISTTSVAFMILIVCATMFAIILYECALKMNDVENFIITFTSSILTVSVMMVMRRVYGYVAIWLTEKEVPRTQQEYDKSYMIKMVIFSLINNYGKLFYVAFFKGKFFTYPGDKEMRLANFPMAAEVCDPTGCVYELFMLMAVINVAKPVMNNFLEIFVPIGVVWINKIKKKVPVLEENLPRWEQDFDLNPSDHFSIMEEFEEMVVQYGFITLLVPAFPLAPLCALINNIFEIRIDSTKMLKYFRKPEPRRNASFHVWFDTLQAMTYLAVVTNALFITFTTNFIPKLIYFIEYNQSLSGFLNFTMSEYKIVDSYWTNVNVSSCWYKGNRYPPGHDHEYGLRYIYFYILSVRLGFAIIFVIFVLFLTAILAYAIPDMPRHVRDQLAYNAKKMREAS